MTTNLSKRQPIGALCLALIVICLAAALGSQLLMQFRVNMILLDTSSHLIGRVQPLSMADLHGETDRPHLANVADLPARLRSLMVGYPGEHRLARTLDTVLVLSGYSSEIETALETADADPLWLYVLAMGEGQQRRFDQVREALSRLPGAARILQSRGLVEWLQTGWYQSGGQEDEGLDRMIYLFEIAKSLDPSVTSDKAEMYKLLSVAYESTGRRQQAIENARLWVEVAPLDYRSSNWLAVLFLWDRRPEDAYLVLQEAEKRIGREYPNFAGQMAQIYESRGDLDTALAEYRIEVKMFPDSPYANAYLAAALHKAGNDREALKYVEVVLRLKDTPPTLRQNAEALKQQILAGTNRP